MDNCYNVVRAANILTATQCRCSKSHIHFSLQELVGQRWAPINDPAERKGIWLIASTHEDGEELQAEGR